MDLFKNHHKVEPFNPVNRRVIGSDFDPSWFCATEMSYAATLFIVILYKLCRILMEREARPIDDNISMGFVKHKKSKNWMSVIVYVLVTVDLAASTALLASLVLTRGLFDDQRKNYITMHMTSTVLYTMQQLLYQLIVL